MDNCFRGDLKAFPGMNDITASLEKEGAKISKATWNGQSSEAEFSSDVSKMIAEGNSINYTVLQKGTVWHLQVKQMMAAAITRIHGG